MLNMFWLKRISRKVCQASSMVFLSLIITACSSDDGRRLSYLQSDAVILAFGDSLTFGKGASAEQAYPAVLQELANRRVINAGISGETSGQGLQRLPSVINKHQPDLLILMHGGNDLLRKHPTSTTRTNLRKMTELAQRAGAEVMLIAVPAPGLFLKPQPLYAELADELGLVIESDIITEVEKDEALKSDAVHPNTEGYRLIAKAIAKKLEQAGAIN